MQDAKCALPNALFGAVLFHLHPSYLGTYFVTKTKKVVRYNLGQK